MRLVLCSAPGSRLQRGWAIAKILEILVAWTPGCMCVSWFLSCIWYVCCFWGVMRSKTQQDVLAGAPAGSAQARLACGVYLRLILVVQLSCTCINCGLELAPSAEEGISVSGVNFPLKSLREGCMQLRARTTKVRQITNLCTISELPLFYSTPQGM